MSAIMANHHPSPPMQMQMHHGPPAAPRPPIPPGSFASSRQTLSQLNEAIWVQLGNARPFLAAHCIPLFACAPMC